MGDGFTFTEKSEEVEEGRGMLLTASAHVVPRVFLFASLVYYGIDVVLVVVFGKLQNCLPSV